MLGLAVIFSCRQVDHVKSSHKESTPEISAPAAIDTLAILERNRSEGEYQYILNEELKAEDLEYLPPSMLRMMRNEIFARYGYVFNSPDLLEHFSACNWYVPLFENVDHLLTDRDKHNLAVILAAEKENQEISRKELFDIYLKDYANPPKALCILFNCAKMSNEYGYEGGFQSRELILKKSQRVKYFLVGIFNGCDQCATQYHIEKYSAEGDFLEYVDFDFPQELDVKIDFYADSLKITSYEASMKPEYKDSVEIYREWGYDEFLPGQFYHVDTTTTLVYLTSTDEISIK